MPLAPYNWYDETNPDTRQDTVSQTTPGTVNDTGRSQLLQTQTGSTLDTGTLADWSADTAQFPTSVVAQGPVGTRWFDQSIQLSGPDGDDIGMVATTAIPALLDISKPLHFLFKTTITGSQEKNNVRIRLWHNYSEEPNNYTELNAGNVRGMGTGFFALPIVPEWINYSGALQDGTDSERGWNPQQSTDNPTLLSRGSAGHWNPLLGIKRIEIALLNYEDTWPIYFGGIIHGYRTDPAVAICMDDARNSMLTQYPSFPGADPNKVGKTVFDYLQERELSCTIGVIRTSVGDAGYLSTAQLNALHMRGFEVGVHGADPLSSGSSPFTDPDDAFDAIGDDNDNAVPDGVLWNRDYVLSVSSNGANSYMYPLNAYRSSGVVWMEGLFDRFEQANFEVARGSFPGWFSFPIGNWTDAKPTWYGFTCYDLENGAADTTANDMFPTFGALKNGIQSLKRIGATTVLQCHNLTTRGARPSDSDTPAVGITTMYVEDLFEVIDYCIDNDVRLLSLGGVVRELKRAGA